LIVIRNLLFLLHGLATAVNLAFAAPGDNDLGAAFGTAISFAYLIRHLMPPFSEYLPI
jgi:hypothetical protein